jgi:hypothetical protein
MSHNKGGFHTFRCPKCGVIGPVTGSKYRPGRMKAPQRVCQQCFEKPAPPACSVFHWRP